MNLRPFRVDADGIHMYAWAPTGRTPYFSDLGVGETVLPVNTSGRARPVTVGLIRAEVRPLWTLEGRFSRWLDRGDADVSCHGPDRQISRRRRLVRGGRQPGRPLRILGRHRGRVAGHRAQLVSARTG